ncbi:MAG TPA: class D sortase [Candidatus Dormibacteraeota bacterium]|nr:class D sortase [Candidatus Dormibacteraeota bacterium]
MAVGIACLLAGAAIGYAAMAPIFTGGSTTIVSSAIWPLTEPAIASPAVDVPRGGVQMGTSVILDGPVDGVAFRMEVPALAYRATVLEGVAKEQLDRGPGHYADSAWPGQPGNVAVAAHNVYWLSFNRLRAGDQVILTTKHGRFVYTVTGSAIVSADDRSPLAQSPEHRLTLTTCYPLWAGAFATQRLVFFATQVD